MSGRESGFFLLLMTILWGMLSAGNLDWFVDIYALAFLAGTILTYLFGNFGIKFFQAPMESLLDKIVESSILAAYLAILIGFVLILMNLSDPMTIGPNMAIVLLSIFYSLLICLFCYMFSKEIRISGFVLASAGIFLCLTLLSFFLLLLAFAK